MKTPFDINPSSREGPPRFRSAFFLSVAAGLLVLAGLSGRSPADNPFLCGIGFGFAVIGLFLAKALVARFVGVVITGVCGGFFSSYLRTLYF